MKKNESQRSWTGRQRGDRGRFGNGLQVHLCVLSRYQLCISLWIKRFFDSKNLDKATENQLLWIKKTVISVKMMKM
jgi:hypothetical protein